MNMNQIKMFIKKIHQDAIVPVQKTHGAAGYDIHSVESITLKPGEKRNIKTGICIEIPHGFVAILKDRSSMADKKIVLSAGVIDSDYRGEVSVILNNNSSSDYHIQTGDRIAQMLILRHEIRPFVEVQELSDTKRGSGGFGSTGK